MAPKNPVYLDPVTLLAQAEYNDVRVPVQADIVEKTVKQRSGKANLGYGGLGAADLDAAMKASRLRHLTSVSGKNFSGGEMGPDQSRRVHWPSVATFSPHPYFYQCLVFRRP